MPQVGFEPTIPVFERAKTFHVIDRAATVIGYKIFRSMKLKPVPKTMCSHNIKEYMWKVCVSSVAPLECEWEL
jgi:hypothetical protein